MRKLLLNLKNSDCLSWDIDFFFPAFELQVKHWRFLGQVCQVLDWNWHLVFRTLDCKQDYAVSFPESSAEMLTANLGTGSFQNHLGLFLIISLFILSLSLFLSLYTVLFVLFFWRTLIQTPCLKDLDFLCWQILVFVWSLQELFKMGT